MKKKAMIILLLIPLLTIVLVEVFASPGVTIENTLIKIETSTTSLGPYVIKKGIIKSTGADLVFYGEYEYFSVDSGLTWNRFSSTRTLLTSSSTSYTIQYGAVNVGEGHTVTIEKKVTVLTGPSRPLANIEYTIWTDGPTYDCLIYYAIDYCDSPIGGGLEDDIYTWHGTTPISTAQWFSGINGLKQNTKGSGWGLLQTYPSTADFYAGSYIDAVDGPISGWGTGYNIVEVDDDMGVSIHIGSIDTTPKVYGDLYIGVFGSSLWTTPPPPTFPVTAIFTITPPLTVQSVGMREYKFLGQHIGSLMHFDSSSSFYLDGSVVSYDWDFGDGNYGSGVTASHAYMNKGTYTVTLIVTDNEGHTADATTKFTIPAAIPSADGGISVPVDKFGLLAPYIGLTSTILVTTAAIVIYVKRVKRGKEKQ